MASDATSSSWSGALNAMIQCGNLQDVDDAPPVPAAAAADVDGGDLADEEDPVFDPASEAGGGVVACSTWRKQLQSISPGLALVAPDAPVAGDAAFWSRLGEDSDDDVGPSRSRSGSGGDEPASMIRFLTCVGEEGKTYDEVVSYPAPYEKAAPVEALYDEILSLKRQVAAMDGAGGPRGEPFSVQDELDRLRRKLDAVERGVAAQGLDSAAPQIVVSEAPLPGDRGRRLSKKKSSLPRVPTPPEALAGSAFSAHLRDIPRVDAPPPPADGPPRSPASVQSAHAQMVASRQAAGVGGGEASDDDLDYSDDDDDDVEEDEDEESDGPPGLATAAVAASPSDACVRFDAARVPISPVTTL